MEELGVNLPWQSGNGKISLMKETYLLHLDPPLGHAVK